MSERVMIKRAIRKLYLIKEVYSDGADDLEMYYFIKDSVFYRYNIETTYSLEEEDGVFVITRNGMKYYFDNDELYNPMTWAMYDEEDDLEDC